MTQQTRETLQSLLEKSTQLLAAVNLKALQTEYQTLEQKTFQPNFWTTPEAQQVMRQISALKSQLEQVDHVQKLQNDVEVYQELLGEDTPATAITTATSTSA